jgi:hypothetical protein
MEVVDMCMLSKSYDGSFQKNHDSMSVSDLFVRIGSTNKLSNFDFVQQLGQNKIFFDF